MITTATTVDLVLAALDQIIADARRESSRLGYFPVFYRQVTVEVKHRIETGDFFDDPERMKRLMVVFANHYLKAYEAFRAGGQVPRSWQVSFAATARYWPIVLQHLLLGMNAHINVDLAIATVEVAGDKLEDLHDDFERINDVLKEMIDQVQARFARVWPLFTLLDRVAKRGDETVINFSLRKARSCAWQAAEDLIGADPEKRRMRMDTLDRHAALLGQAILHPGLATSAVIKTIRLGETQNVAKAIDLLLRE